MKVNSTIKMNFGKIKQLTKAQATAMEMTVEALHTEVVQSEIVPRDEGTLQNESTFVDYSDSSKGRVQLVSSTPYARRLYYHPEYRFQTDENSNAQGNWYEPWLPGGISENFCKNAFKKLYKRIGGV